MSKYVVIVFCSLLVIGSAKAQSNKTYIGINFLPIFYELEDDDDFTTNNQKFSFDSYFIVGIRLGNHITLNAGIGYSYKAHEQLYYYPFTPAGIYNKSAEKSFKYSSFPVSIYGFLYSSQRLSFYLKTGLILKSLRQKNQVITTYDNSQKIGFDYKCQFNQSPKYAFVSIGFELNLSKDLYLQIEPIFQYMLNDTSLMLCEDTSRKAYGLSIGIIYNLNI